MSRGNSDELVILKQEVAELKLRMATLEKSLPSMVPRSNIGGEPVDSGESNLRERFHSLVAQWKAQRGPTSRLEKMVLHPAYQQIIGLGKPAIPLLLAEFEQCPSHWDWALTAITGIDPVAKESYGKLNEIARAWIAWGRAEGYRW